MVAQVIGTSDLFPKKVDMWLQHGVTALRVCKRVGLEVFLVADASPGPSHDATTTLELKSLTVGECELALVQRYKLAKISPQLNK